MLLFVFKLQHFVLEIKYFRSFACREILLFTLASDHLLYHDDTYIQMYV